MSSSSSSSRRLNKRIKSVKQKARSGYYFIIEINK